MSEFRYSDVERQLVEALPEIRPSAQFYWDTEGIPGRDSGPYIFFEQLFACYVEVLLVLPSCARRDELLRKAFDVVDDMFGSVDRDVRDLAAIGLFEGRDASWFTRAIPFIGPRATVWLDAYEPDWRHCQSVKDLVTSEILDGYHVRALVAGELRHEGVTLNDVPGTTYATGGLPNMPPQPMSGDGRPDDSKD